MRTLDYWISRLTRVPSTIECPQMQLWSSNDHEPPVFVGPGHIDIRSRTHIDFTMFAEPVDGSDAFRRLVRAKENPYEIFDQFRLEATDYEGHSWACGWTRPTLKGLPKTGWPLTGQLTSLVTHPSGPWVSQESSVELMFQPKLRIPMDQRMVSVASIGNEEISRLFSDGQHTIQVLDTEITFFHLPSDDFLWVTARTSEKLQHPYAENWISEPLRILLGQFAFPRLVARNLGNGRTHVWLRQSPQLIGDPRFSSLIKGNLFDPKANFWEVYANLLTLIAEAKDEKGHPNFEAHQITRFYEEIIQATHGSRWVLCLTLASAAEGLAKMLMRPEERKSDYSEAELSHLKSHIAAWKGDAGLRERALNFVAYVSERANARYLQDLVTRDVLEQSQVDAWREVRNQVMHGNLVSPWATKEEDQRILQLANLVHGLTHELIRTCVKQR